MAEEPIESTPEPTLTAQPDDPLKVRIGARERDLKLPTSYAVRHEVVAAFHENRQRALAAALGLCCPRIERDLATEKRAIAPYGKDCSPLRYGGDVIDGLVGLGGNISDIMAAGLKALTLIAESLTDESEVKAARGN